MVMGRWSSMKRKLLIGIAVATLVIALIPIMVLTFWTKGEVNGWLWKKPEDEYPRTEYLPPCDTLYLQEEFRLRSQALQKADGRWIVDEEDEFDLYYSMEVGEDSCLKGLDFKYCSSGSGAGNIWEREVYTSGKKLLVVNSDVPEGSVDTVCECVEIAFSYCEREVKYTLETGEENYKHWDQVDHKYLSRAEADSVLLSWGIRRELPPEDHPWLYREEQLRKAEESQR